MRKDSMSLLDHVPPEEESEAELGDPDYEEKARAEAKRYIDLIARKMGPPPPNTRLKVVGNPHDFGTYLTVDVEYLEGDELGTHYAMACVDEGPIDWHDAEPFDWRGHYGL